MNEIKFLNLLDGIVNQDNIDLMELAAKEHRKYSNITFRIVESSAKSITIGVTQGKSSAGNYQTKKRLIEIVHETFDRFFPGFKIKVHANEYKQPDVNSVDVKWIAERMSTLKISAKNISDETGMNYSSITEITSGSTTISQQMKAFFWFYFLSKEQSIKLATTIAEL